MRYITCCFGGLKYGHPMPCIPCSQYGVQNGWPGCGWKTGAAKGSCSSVEGCVMCTGIGLPTGWHVGHVGFGVSEWQARQAARRDMMTRANWQPTAWQLEVRSLAGLRRREKRRANGRVILSTLLRRWLSGLFVNGKNHGITKNLFFKVLSGRGEGG